MSDDDGNLSISADVDGGNDGFRAAGGVSHCKGLVEGGLANGEKERLALEDDGEEDEEWDGRIRRR